MGGGRHRHLRCALRPAGRAGHRLSAFVWNPAQAAVIAAPAEARLVVDAGPGTGKTATAAGRIAALLAAGLAADSLWTISFSRAAVGEMRQRLVALGGADMALGHVTTLDSLAWYLRAEDDDGMVLEGHDRAIEETLAGLRGRDPQMRQRIATIRHFTIDEAQDLVGVRALLVVELLDALPAICGATILTDEAQAIYGFSAGVLSSSFTADTVARHMLDLDDSHYQLHRLSQVHRTGDRQLLRLFDKARARALHQTPNPQVKLARMRRAVAGRAHGKVKGSDADADTLILYRSRAEVLAAAQARFERGQPYRLRLSGLPVMLQPWIAEVLGDYESVMLPRWQFEDLWQARIGGNAIPAWTALTQATGMPGADRIALKRLLAILRTSHPPSELCRFDPGDEIGPIVGTIHASKGRESAQVQLMLPQGKTGGDDPDAEARVLFVGATRARHLLEIGKGLRLGAKQLGNGRVFVPLSATSCRVELGRPGDFEWLMQTSPLPEDYENHTSFDSSPTNYVILGAGRGPIPPLDSQNLNIGTMGPRPGPRMTGLGKGGKSGDIAIGSKLDLSFADGTLQITHNSHILGTATSALMNDLRHIRQRLSGVADYKRWTADIDGVAFLGLYTLARDPVSSRETGLSLVPAVSGFSTCNFN